MEQKYIKLSEKEFGDLLLKIQSAVLFWAAQKGLVTLAEREAALSRCEIPQDDE